MSELSDPEIRDIIERVRRRVAAAGETRPGEGLRAEAELAIAAGELGDGIHPTVDAAVAAATRAYETFRSPGLAGR